MLARENGGHRGCGEIGETLLPEEQQRWHHMEKILFQNKIVLHVKLPCCGACDFLWQQWPLLLERAVSCSTVLGFENILK